VVLERLRQMGYAPAAEGPEGDVLVHRADVRRASVRRPPARLVTTSAAAPPALLDAAVRAVRAGDRALTAVKRRDPGTDDPGASRLPRNGTADILAMLAEGVRSRASMWIGYVNAEGHATQRVVEPISVEGGYVKAYDHLRDEVRTFAIHRITGVSHLDETAS
jgi:predicted DNA-binding transcriptional regulator YafY